MSDSAEKDTACMNERELAKRTGVSVERCAAFMRGARAGDTPTYLDGYVAACCEVVEELAAYERQGLELPEAIRLTEQRLSVITSPHTMPRLDERIDAALADASFAPRVIPPEVSTAPRSTRCKGCHGRIWAHDPITRVGWYDYHPECAPEHPLERTQSPSEES